MQEEDLRHLKRIVVSALRPRTRPTRRVMAIRGIAQRIRRRTATNTGSEATPGSVTSFVQQVTEAVAEAWLRLAQQQKTNETAIFQDTIRLGS